MNRKPAAAALALMMSLCAISAAAPAAGAYTDASAYVSLKKTTATDKTNSTDNKKETKKKLYGWQTIDGKKYYYGKKGVPLKGWKRLSGFQYYFNPGTGEATTGVADIDHATYYFGTDGKMKTGFQTIDKKKYWFANDGKMLKNTEKKISGKYYIFDEDGVIISTNSSEGGKKIITIDKLRNRTSLRGDLTDDEWKDAYAEAMRVVEPLLNKSKEEQIKGVVEEIYNRKCYILVSDGMIHSSDPYGFFVDGVTNCEGTAKSVGLCLDMLDISYEKVSGGWNDSTWIRIKVGNDYYIADGFNNYYVKEQEPYKHPYL